jgi:hypothetical protein
VVACRRADEVPSDDDTIPEQTSKAILGVSFGRLNLGDALRGDAGLVGRISHVMKRQPASDRDRAVKPQAIVTQAGGGEDE